MPPEICSAKSMSAAYLQITLMMTSQFTPRYDPTTQLHKSSVSHRAKGQGRICKRSGTKRYTVPSTSTASAGFFFVEKKGGELWPCIDYRGLNQLSVKYPYLLPVMSSALEQLCSACILKLDLHSTTPDPHPWSTTWTTSVLGRQRPVPPLVTTNTNHALWVILCYISIPVFY